MQNGKTRGGVDRRAFLTGAMLLGGMAGSLPVLAGRSLAADAKPRQGGTFKLGMSGGAASDSLDPRLLTDWVPVNICYQIMNGLVEIGRDNKPIPELFESWEVKPGAKEWIFNVRKGVTFSNGKTLTPEDIIYSLNLHRGDTKSAGKVNVEDVTELKKLGPNQVGITLGSGNLDLPYLLTDYHFMVVPDGHTDWSKPIGTGGYVLETFDPGVRAVTRKHGNYWKPDCANVDSIETMVINDTSARTNALITGQVDVINRLNPRTVKLLTKNPHLQIVRSAAGQHATFLMNTTDKPFTDNNVRLAMKYGVDRQKMIDTVLDGYGQIGNDQPIPRSNPFCATDLPQHSYDPDKAKFYLKQAGLTELPVTLQVSEAAFTGATDAAVLYQANATACGIKIDVKREPSDGYWDNVWMKVPFCVSYWGGRPTADQMLTIAYQSDAKWNETDWKRPEFDKILVAARTEADEAKRKAMYGDLERMISEDGGAIIPMFIDYLEAGSTRVQGMQPNPMFDLMGQRIGEKIWLAA